MPRLIDADELLKENFTETFVDPLDQPIFEWIIEQTPTIEAEPVRHGRWKEISDDYEICATEFECSNCKESFCTSELSDKEFRKMMKYCPNCGAKMDLEG